MLYGYITVIQIDGKTSLYCHSTNTRIFNLYLKRMKHFILAMIYLNHSTTVKYKHKNMFERLYHYKLNELLLQSVYLVCIALDKTFNLR